MSMPPSTHIQTRSQQLAELAFKQVSHVDLQTKDDKNARDKYIRFAKRFPSLIHTCGLAQAIAFAQSKAPDRFVNDLRQVLNCDKSEPAFTAEIRSSDLTRYLQMSRTALQAAGWLKRYAEALLEDQ